MADRDTPLAMRGSVKGQLLAADAVLPRLASRLDLVMTVPLAFGTGSARDDAGRAAIRAKLLETASGRWDADYTYVAQTLAAGGYGDAMVRLGHEMTGPFYPWSSQGNGDAYIAAFRHVHDVLLAVAPNLRFEWNVARTTFNQYGADAYPGDEYVDAIGIDIYYRPLEGDPTPFTEDVWNRRYQAILQAHQAFAVAHGKPVSYAEWANGDVDEPSFIDHMYRWFASLPPSGPGRLLYQSYFNVSKPSFDLANYPRSASMYQRRFGVVADGTPMYTGAATREVVPFYRNTVEAGSVTFERVTAAGTTTVTPLASGSAAYVAPYGFRLNDRDPVVLGARTTAAYTGKVSVCVRYPVDGFGPGEPAQLLAYRGAYPDGAWENVTGTVDPVAGTVCGSPSELGPFAVGTGFNSQPRAVAVEVAATEDNGVQITLSGTDADDDALTFAVQAPQHGRIGQPGDVSCTGSRPRTCTATVAYLPDPDFAGSDAFTFTTTDGRLVSGPATAKVSVAPVADAPTATDGSARTAEDTPVRIGLRGTDPDGSGVTFEIVDAPTKGLLGPLEAPICQGSAPTVCTASIGYSPAPDWSGSDAFTYRVRNGTGTAAAKVSLVVDPVNDRPACSMASLVVDEDTAGSVPAPCVDVDGDSLVYRVVTAPSSGSVSVVGSSFTYSPAADFNGSDSFEFVAQDGEGPSVPATATVSVRAVNDRPVCSVGSLVVDEDTAGSVSVSCVDVDGDSLVYRVVTAPSSGSVSVVGSSLRYVPAADFNGSDSFAVVADDGQALSVPVSVPVTVRAVNDLPTGAALQVATDEDASLTVVLQGRDVDGDDLTFAVTTAPAHGTIGPLGAVTCTGAAVRVCTASLTYTPAAGFSGDDAFGYVVRDGSMAAATTPTPAMTTPVAMTVRLVVDPTSLVATVPAVDGDANGTTAFAVALSSADATCVAGQPVTFASSANGVDWVTLGSGPTGPDGKAALTAAVAPGVYEVRAVFAGSATCAPSAATGSVLTVTAAGSALSGASTGGGWYSSATAPGVRSGFGFDLRKSVNSKTGAVINSGTMVWVQPRATRLRSTAITAIAAATTCDATKYVRCSVVSGTGMVSKWVLDSARPEGGYWGPGTAVRFTAKVNDGGTAQVCVNAVCSPQDRTDAFGVQVTPTLFAGQSAAVPLGGGSVRLG